MTEAQPRPTLLSQAHVSKALGDPRFFDAVPEYTPLRAKIQAMHVDLQSKRGCSGCKRRRVVANTFKDFLSVTAALSPDGIRRLKQYLGISRLMLNVYDRQAGKVQLRIV